MACYKLKLRKMVRVMPLVDLALAADSRAALREAFAVLIARYFPEATLLWALCRR